MMETNDTSNPVRHSGAASCERRCGEDLRQWQVQERTERLQVLIAILSELARRLLMAHPDWEVQEQVHLDHTSLEARARPVAEAVVVECRWSEDARWRGCGAVEVSVSRFAAFPVVATLDALECEAGWSWHGLEHLVQGIEWEVEQEIVSRALIAPEGVTRLAPQLF